MYVSIWYEFMEISTLIVDKWGHNFGELAQLAERVLSMHEVAGSIPAFSNENRVY